MTYMRVFPRDLFNEAGLLKCLGRLVICLEDIAGPHGASLPEFMAGPLPIEQNPASGGIFLNGFFLSCNGLTWRLERPLNSREPWPLYATDPDEDRDEIEIFDDQGNLTPEFLGLIRKDF